jgi:hypothetical protein
MLRDSVALMLGVGAIQACPHRTPEVLPPPDSAAPLVLEPLDRGGSPMPCRHEDGPNLCHALACPHARAMLAPAMRSLGKGMAWKFADALGVPELAPLAEIGYELGRISGRRRRRE